MIRLSTAGLDEWLDACRRAGLEMRRSGRDWCGPCPVCQTGDDRFAIRAGEKRPVIVSARCGHTWLDVMRALNPDIGSGGDVARTATACRRDTRRIRPLVSHIFGGFRPTSATTGGREGQNPVATAS